MKKTSIPNYLHVFEGRIDHLRKEIQAECEKPRRDRSRSKLKKFLAEARELRDAVREAREEHAIKCPHCGKRI